MGFLGIAGIDIGLGYDGRLLVFDPNFRFASSTPQRLFHDSAVVRSGRQVSRSFQAKPGGSFADLAARIEGPISEGWFVPTRFLNGEKHTHSQGRHIVTGFVMGHTRTEAEASVAALLKDLEQG